MIDFAVNQVLTPAEQAGPQNGSDDESDDSSDKKTKNKNGSGDASDDESGGASDKKKDRRQRGTGGSDDESDNDFINWVIQNPENNEDYTAEQADPMPMYVLTRSFIACLSYYLRRER